MGCIMMRKCLQVCTRVRTTNGMKKIKDVEIGDTLLDGNGAGVLCLATNPLTAT
jgi:hypothetical protein